MKVHPVYSSEDVLMFSYKTAIDIIDKNIEGDFVIRIFVVSTL